MKDEKSLHMQVSEVTIVDTVSVGYTFLFLSHFEDVQGGGCLYFLPRVSLF